MSQLMANLVLKFPSCCCHSNRSSAQISVCRNLNHSEIDWPPKHTVWCKNLRPILTLSGFIVNIVCIFEDFSYRGNRITDTFSLAWLNWPPRKPSIWCKNLGDILYTVQAELYFLLKFANFCYHGNKGGSSKILNDSIRLADPKTPTLVQNSRTYLKCELCYCDFCVEISKFSLPWQHGNMIHISVSQLNRQTQKTPYLAQEFGWYLIHKLRHSRISDEIYQFLLP